MKTMSTLNILILAIWLFSSIHQSTGQWYAGSIMRPWQGTVSTAVGDFSRALIKVTFSQPGGPGSPVSIVALVSGVPAGTYGFHVHTFGDLTSVIDDSGNPTLSISTAVLATAKATDKLGVGSHFNPTGQHHDCAQNTPRHAGDIGTSAGITITDPTIVTEVDVSSSLIDLASTQDTIIGRAVLMHSKPDLCAIAQPVGNASTPVLQGVIGILNPAFTTPISSQNLASFTADTSPVSLVATMFDTTNINNVIYGKVRIQIISSSGEVRMFGGLGSLAAGQQYALAINQYGDEFNQGAGSGAPLYRIQNVTADSLGTAKFDITFAGSTVTFPQLVGKMFVVYDGTDFTQPRKFHGTIGVSQTPPQLSSAISHNINAQITLVASVVIAIVSVFFFS